MVRSTREGTCKCGPAGLRVRSRVGCVATRQDREAAIARGLRCAHSAGIALLPCKTTPSRARARAAGGGGLVDTGTAPERHADRVAEPLSRGLGRFLVVVGLEEGLAAAERTRGRPWRAPRWARTSHWSRCGATGATTPCARALGPPMALGNSHRQLAPAVCERLDGMGPVPLHQTKRDRSRTGHGTPAMPRRSAFGAPQRLAEAVGSRVRTPRLHGMSARRCKQLQPSFEIVICSHLGCGV